MNKRKKIRALKCIIEDLKFIELDSQRDENFEEIYKDLEKDINQLSRISKLKFLGKEKNVKR